MIPIDEQPTQPMRSQLDPATRVTGLDLSLEREMLVVHPAASASIKIGLQNQSQSGKEIRVVATGLPDDWVQLSKAELRLGAGEFETIELTVAPQRRSDLPPADYPCVVAVSDASGATTQQQLIVRLGGFAGLSVALAPSSIDDDGRFSLVLRNQGNVNLALRIGARDQSGNLEITLPRNRLDIAPGQKEELACRVKARRRSLVGAVRQLPFALILTAEGRSGWQIGLPAATTVKPGLTPSWLTVLALAVIAVGLGIAAFALRVSPTLP